MRTCRIRAIVFPAGTSSEPRTRITLGEFIGLTIAGLALGAIYAIAASGLVVTYTTSGIFNFAHGAIGMLMAFVYWQLRVEQHWNAPLALFVALLLVAPAIGLMIQAALIRRL